MEFATTVHLAFVLQKSFLQVDGDKLYFIEQKLQLQAVGWIG